jgi:MurNAc alpha-1-phosphate uridylyltransferase
MTGPLSDTAMVLAAGLGTRMRPLTLAKPKPLQEIGGRTMLDLTLDKLVQAGVKRAVVNTCYLAEQIEEHVKSRHDLSIVISRETELLETGGAIAKIVPIFEGKAFFALNADLPWTDRGEPSLQLMRGRWDADIMDVLLLIMRTDRARGFVKDKGDFVVNEEGALKRKTHSEPRPYVFVSAQILKSEFFEHPPSKVFSNRLAWDSAEDKGRLYGIEHQGTCYHVGTVSDLEEANALLASGKGWGY